MAVTNTLNKKNAGVAPVSPVGSVAGAKATNKGAKASEEIQKKGQEILAQMDEERKKNLGSMQGTLHFVQLLGLASQQVPRRISKDETKDAPKPVGITLVSDVDIEVPVIDVTKDNKTGIEPEDISYRKVKAGEKFDLTYYEFMFLIIQDQYVGFCEANGDPQGLRFSPKLPAFVRGSQPLPTPAVNFRTGAIKTQMIEIDQEGPNGWEIKPEYAEKFGDLLKKKKPARAAGVRKNTTPPTTVVAVALQNLLLNSKKK